MNGLLFNIYLITLMFAPPVILALWFFGLRRYLAKKGKARITAANWGLSMWADWSEAWEIGRSEKKMPFCVIAFLLVHVAILAVALIWVFVL